MKRSNYNQHIFSFFIFTSVIHFIVTTIFKTQFNWSFFLITLTLTALLLLVKIDIVALVIERFFSLLHSFNNILFMGIVFYGVLTPVGLIRRVCKNNQLKKTLSKESSTYLESPGIRSNDFEKPF